jgi:hypothetical protein
MMMTQPEFEARKKQLRRVETLAGRAAQKARAVDAYGPAMPRGTRDATYGKGLT